MSNSASNGDDVIKFIDVYNDKFEPKTWNEPAMMTSAMMGDAAIRVWLILRIRNDIDRKWHGPALSEMNANVKMIAFAKEAFPMCHGKKIADNFEAYIWHLYNFNPTKMNEVMWKFYAFLLKEKVDSYVVCPLLKKKLS